jgi:hypothetical protein
MSTRVEMLCRCLEEAVMKLDSTACLEVLSCLKECPISVHVLRSTGAGKTLNRLLCRDNLPVGLDASVFTAAFTLLCSWRAIVAAERANGDAESMSDTQTVEGAEKVGHDGITTLTEIGTYLFY